MQPLNKKLNRLINKNNKIYMLGLKFSDWKEYIKIFNNLIL